MTETRAVLLGFAIVALVMVSLPIAMISMVVMAAQPSEPGDTGEVSRLFLKPAPGAPSASSEHVVSVDLVLSSGLPETTALRTLAASRFTSMTDNDAAICHRSYDDLSCTKDWTVDLLFHRDAIRSTIGNRIWTCL